MDVDFVRAENSPEVSGDAALSSSLSLLFVFSARRLDIATPSGGKTARQHVPRLIGECKAMRG
jgi:hypothetical protein